MVKHRVLLVEDDEDLLESVSEYLDLAGFSVTGVCTAADFYRIVLTSTWDIAVIDVGLPDQSGYVLAEYLKKNTDTSVIMLTARDGVDDKVKGYDSGADIYLVKPVELRELTAALNSISARKNTDKRRDSDLAETWILEKSSWSIVTPVGNRIQLTNKESRFLQIVASSPGLPIKREDVLQSVYQRYDEYASRSLDSLVKRLRVKLTSENEEYTMPIKTIHGVGYSFISKVKLT